MCFQGAKKRKTKETTSAAPAAESQPGGDGSAEKPQIQIVDGAVDGDDDEEDVNTYRRKTVCSGSV